MLALCLSSIKRGLNSQMSGSELVHVQSLTPSGCPGHRQTQFSEAEFGSPGNHGMAGQAAPCEEQYQLLLDDNMSVPLRHAATLAPPCELNSAIIS